MGFLSPGEWASVLLALAVAGPSPLADAGPSSVLDLRVSAADLQGPLLYAATLGDVDATRATAPRTVSLGAALLDLYDAVGVDLDAREAQRMGRTARALDAELRAALAPLVVATADAYRASAAQLDRVEAAELRATCAEADPLGRAHRELGAKLDRSAFVGGALGILAATESAIPLLRDATAPGPGPFALDPYGLVVVSGAAGRAHPDSVTDALLFVDLGGDDTYGATGGASGCAGPDPIDFGYDTTRVFLDFEGDDTYVAPTEQHASQGTSQHGVGIHVDVEGNDVYHAKMFQQGYGEVAGVGVLLDLAGDDGYAVSAYGQGTGAVYGIGILADGGGKDRYTGYNFTYVGRFAQQGVGFLRGVGLLLDDGDGADQYVTRERASEDCLCQGTSFGFGAGVLVDRGGDDYYGTNRGRAVVSLGLGPGPPSGTALFADLGGDDAYEGTTRGEDNEPWGRGVTRDMVERGQDCEPPAVPCEVF